jgi:hypothetical protein
MRRTRPMMDREKVAIEVLRCALAWEPDVCVVGNVMAMELAVLAASAIGTCPKCGATAWTDIDCDLCTTIAELWEKGNKQ